MAKISARGDREVARWRKHNGAYVVLTERGRVLSQFIEGDAYHVAATFRKDIPLERRLKLIENWHFSGIPITRVEAR